MLADPEVAVDHSSTSWIAISTAIYRGAKRPTLKTDEKQPKKSRKGCRVGRGPTCSKTAEKQLEEQPKHPKNSCVDCFSGGSAVLLAVFHLGYRNPLGTLFDTNCNPVEVIVHYLFVPFGQRNQLQFVWMQTELPIIEKS